jgi:ERCC4-type nuclease
MNDSIGRLSKEIDGVAQLMDTIAIKMKYYGGFDKFMNAHANELHGAADIARGWAKEINKQIKKKKHDKKKKSARK